LNESINDVVIIDYESSLLYTTRKEQHILRKLTNE